MAKLNIERNPKDTAQARLSSPAFGFSHGESYVDLYKSEEGIFLA